MSQEKNSLSWLESRMCGINQRVTGSSPAEGAEETGLQHVGGCNPFSFAYNLHTNNTQKGSSSSDSAPIYIRTVDCNYLTIQNSYSFSIGFPIPLLICQSVNLFSVLLEPLRLVCIRLFQLVCSCYVRKTPLQCDFCSDRVKFQ